MGIKMEDTICAISTPIGNGGIGIIRLSGDDSLSICQKVFRPAGKDEWVDVRDRYLIYGHIVNPQNGKTVDEVMAVYMKGPRTYTCEDVVEVQCHGGMVLLEEILMIFIGLGARMAEPGEFTKRAFLGGRLDLAQAEAIIDIINAKGKKSSQNAISQLEGHMSAQIQEVRDDIMDLLVDTAVNIDYPDEDIEELTYERLISNSNKIKEKLLKLLSSAETGRIVKEGLNVSIVGRPNVGKSSLLNNLLREARAIVTDIPGTTRDSIMESLSVRGIPVNIVDTAGIRETEDLIEKIGIEKSKDSIEKADIVIVVIDGSQYITAEDEEILKMASSKPCLVLLNKRDVTEKYIEENKSRIAIALQGSSSPFAIVETSMKDRVGIGKIEDFIYNQVWKEGQEIDGQVFLTNVRHVGLVRDALGSMEDTIAMAENGEPLEIIEIDINSAYRSLGLILGLEAEGDIIDEVFSRFCLGK